MTTQAFDAEIRQFELLAAAAEQLHRTMQLYAEGRSEESAKLVHLIETMAAALSGSQRW